MYATKLLALCNRRISIKYSLSFSFKVPHRILSVQHTGWRKRRENFCVTGSCSNSLVWYAPSLNSHCSSLSLSVSLVVVDIITFYFTFSNFLLLLPSPSPSIPSFSLFLLISTSNFPLFPALVVYYTILRLPLPRPLPLM
jgi:hypothetical protein